MSEILVFGHDKWPAKSGSFVSTDLVKFTASRRRAAKVVENVHFYLMRQFLIILNIKSQKKVCRTSMDASVCVLRHNLGHFGLVLEIDLLLYNSGNFGHDHKLGDFDVNWENFRSFWGKAPPTIWQYRR